jgi:hypothetical protein
MCTVYIYIYKIIPLSDVLYGYESCLLSKEKNIIIGFEVLT